MLPSFVILKALLYQSEVFGAEVAATPTLKASSLIGHLEMVKAPIEDFESEFIPHRVIQTL